MRQIPPLECAVIDHCDRDDGRHTCEMAGDQLGKIRVDVKAFVFSDIFAVLSCAEDQHRYAAAYLDISNSPSTRQARAAQLTWHIDYSKAADDCQTLERLATPGVMNGGCGLT